MLVFGLVWGVTFGKHHLWLLPNLTEDVGFAASFWPLYKVLISLHGTSFNV
jgi:translocation protein SEC62